MKELKPFQFLMENSETQWCNVKCDKLICWEMKLDWFGTDKIPELLCWPSLTIPTLPNSHLAHSAISRSGYAQFLVLNSHYLKPDFLFFRNTSTLLFVFHICYYNNGNIKHFLNVINWDTLIGFFLGMSHGCRWEAESEKHLICRGSAWQKKTLIFFCV